MGPDVLSRFLPPAERGVAVDGAVRGQLASSLEVLYTRARSIIDFDEGALKKLIDIINRGPVRPAVFGTYTELVESIAAGHASTAQDLSEQLLGLSAPCHEIRIVTLNDDDLGAGQSQRYARLINDDPEQSIHLQPLNDQEGPALAVRTALSLIEAGAPDLAQEIRALAREIVMVDSDISPETGELSEFDGASTFYLWGAIFSRIRGKSPADIAQTLAHETGHLLLFGLMMGRPLVENTEDERYDSPLRQDPRPMEGVVHAAYVLARMHYTLSSLLRAGLILPAEQEQARCQLVDYARSFFDSLSMIERYARFTHLGGHVFGGAVAYMKNAC